MSGLLPKLTYKESLLFLYVVLLHIVLGVVLWKSDFLEGLSYRLGLGDRPELTGYYYTILNVHDSFVDIVPDGAVIFIGDSITQRLNVSAVHPLSVNYGIGGDTTIGVLKRLSTYMSVLERSQCIVLAIGTNDTRYRSVDEAIANYSRILDRLPRDRPVIASAVLPVDDQANPRQLSEAVGWRMDFNIKLHQLVEQREWVIFVDHDNYLDTNGDGRLDQQFHNGDGLHLNAAGNLQWTQSLRRAISNLKPTNQNNTDNSLFIPGETE